MSLANNPSAPTPARLFLAIPIGGGAAAALTRGLNEFRRLAPGLKWEVPEALHLTLKFIGAWNDPESIVAALAPHAWPTLTVGLHGLGAFPDRSRPRTLWAAAEPAAALAQWARLIEQRLAPLGIAAEARPFVPHVSLARVRERRAAIPIRPRLDLRRPDWGTFPVDAFTLFQTVAGLPASQRYRPLHRFPTG